MRTARTQERAGCFDRKLSKLLTFVNQQTDEWRSLSPDGEWFFRQRLPENSRRRRLDLGRESGAKVKRLRNKIFMDWDIQIFHLINGLAGHWSWLDETMKAISDPSSYFVPGFLIFAYWLWKYRRQAVIQAALLSLLVIGVDLIGAQIKQRSARPRPCLALQHVKAITGCGDAFSFPSNHAANSAAVTAFLQSLYPRVGWIAWPLVVLIGVSRIYTGAHYASDVVGGWLLGACMAWGFAALLRRIRKQNG